jgi:hypothetical protein
VAITCNQKSDAANCSLLSKQMFLAQTYQFQVQGSGFKVQGLQPMEAAHDIDQDPEYPA